MDYAGLMMHRKEFGCHRIMLTHMSEDVLKRIEQLEVETADDGKRIIL